MQEIQEIIAKKFPSLVDIRLQEKIASVGRLLSIPEGKIVIDTGAYIRSIPLVISGALKVMREDDQGHELFLYYLLTGQACSMSLTCCMASKKSEVKAVAEESTELIVLPASEMELMTNEYPTWKNFVMNTHMARFNELLQTIDDIAFKRLDERLISYLNQKKNLQTSASLQITHQEIAHDLNSSREVISRLLKQLEKKEIIKLGRNKIELV